jgi:hypothetical protein
MEQLEQQYGGDTSEEKVKALKTSYEALARAKIEASIAAAAGNADEAAAIERFIQEQTVSLELQRRFNIAEAEANDLGRQAVAAEEKKAAAAASTKAAAREAAEARRAQTQAELEASRAQTGTARAAGRAQRGFFQAAAGMNAMTAAASSSRNVISGLTSALSALTLISGSAIVAGIGLLAGAVGMVVTRLREQKAAAEEAAKSHAELMDEVTGKADVVAGAMDRQKEAVSRFVQKQQTATEEVDATVRALGRQLAAMQRIQEAQKATELAQVDMDETMPMEKKAMAKLEIERRYAKMRGENEEQLIAAQIQAAEARARIANETAQQSNTDAGAATGEVASRHLEAKNLYRQRDELQERVDRHKELVRALRHEEAVRPDRVNQREVERLEKEIAGTGINIPRAEGTIKQIDERIRAMRGKPAEGDAPMEEGFRPNAELKKAAEEAKARAQADTAAAQKAARESADEIRGLQAEKNAAAAEREQEELRRVQAENAERKKMADRMKAEKEALEKAANEEALKDAALEPDKARQLRERNREIDKAQVDRTHRDNPEIAAEKKELIDRTGIREEQEPRGKSMEQEEEAAQARAEAAGSARSILDRKRPAVFGADKRAAAAAQTLLAATRGGDNAAVAEAIQATVAALEAAAKQIQSQNNEKQQLQSEINSLKQATENLRKATDTAQSQARYGRS